MFATADAVMVTPNAAIAAIFCSRIFSNDWTTLEADPTKLMCNRNGGAGEVSSKRKVVGKRRVKQTYDAWNSSCCALSVRKYMTKQTANVTRKRTRKTNALRFRTY